MMWIFLVLGLIFAGLLVWRRRASILRLARGGRRVGGKGYYTYAVYK